MIRDAGSAYSKPLADLLQIAFGPKVLLEQALAGMAGIEGAYLFGSYAARYAGEPGPIPNDIDLLVIGSPDRDDVHDAVTTVSTRLRKDIQVAFRTTKSWRSGTDAFVTTLKSRPLVELDLTDSQETAPR